VYTMSVSVTGTEADKAIINSTVALITSYLPTSFVPQYAFIATWNKMKYADANVSERRFFCPRVFVFKC